MALVSYFFVVVENLCFCYESLFHFDSELYKHSFFLWSKSNFISKFPINYFSTHKNFQSLRTDFFYFHRYHLFRFQKEQIEKQSLKHPFFLFISIILLIVSYFSFLDFCLKWLLSSPFFFSSPFPSLPYSSSSFFIIIFFWTF